MAAEGKDSNVALRFYIFLLIVLVIVAMFVYRYLTREPPPPSEAPPAGSTASRPAEQPPTAPATEPATAPATSPATAPATPPAETSPWALPLSADERIIYDAAMPLLRQYRETAWYMLLSRTADLPALDAQRLEQLPRPAYDHLLRHPELYAAQKMRLRIIPVSVTKLQPGSGMGHSPWWQPADRAVWRIDCLHAAAEYPGNEPLIVFSVVEPVALGKPDKVDEDGNELFLRARRFEAAAVFYKVYETADREGRWRQYPLLLAWQIEPAGGTGWLKDAVTTPFVTLMVGMVVTVGVAYGLLRRRARGAPARPPMVEYRPRRFEEGREAPPPPPPAGEEPARVDPLLERAAEQHRKERQDDGAAEHTG